MGSISYFGSSTVSDNTSVLSYISLDDLVSKTSSDGYFDSTSKIGQVQVFYFHEDGRQNKRIVHDASSHQGTVTWYAGARDGTWQKTRIKVMNKDGAIIELDRNDIGTGEDATHSGGQMILNTD